MFYTYIIESESSGVYYKGSTDNYLKRLEQHQNGVSAYTKGKGPWKLIFVQEFFSRSEALKEEKRLKRCNKIYLQWLIQQPVNMINSLDR